MALVMVPWALGVFSSNSGQQARVAAAAPAFAAALLALNTSAIYVGQAVGAAAGGAALAATGFGALSWVASGFMLVALALSLFLVRHRYEQTTPG